MKVLVGAFNQEKALIGAFSVIVKLSVTFVSSSNAQTADPYLILVPLLLTVAYRWMHSSGGAVPDRHHSMQLHQGLQSICQVSTCSPPGDELRSLASGSRPGLRR